MYVYPPSPIPCPPQASRTSQGPTAAAVAHADFGRPCIPGSPGPPGLLGWHVIPPHFPPTQWGIYNTKYIKKTFVDLYLKCIIKYIHVYNKEYIHFFFYIYIYIYVIGHLKMPRGQNTKFSSQHIPFVETDVSNRNMFCLDPCEWT